MTFKKDWEKTDQDFQIGIPILEAMLDHALPNQKVSSHTVISGGCANLNIKVNFEKRSEPLILRIYLRDKDAAYREQKLATLINHSVPIPEVYFVGDIDNYRFAITQFKYGITLRDLLLDNKTENIKNLMKEAGLILAKIQSYRFPHSGFFDRDLHIATKLPKNYGISFAKKCLEHPTTLEQISKENLSKIDTYLDQYHFLFPDENQNHLVHADYDPANILVHQIHGEWVISGILDWEFAFSGSSLCDVANMLRYAHHMQPDFETSFLEGLQQGGVQLADSWRISIYLLNLLSLLDCLIRCPPNLRPRQCADICSLIDYILKCLDKIK